MRCLGLRSADRPQIELEPTSFELAMNLAAWVGVALHGVVVIRYWPLLPAEVPRHFDARGAVDAWGPRALLLLLPGLAVLLVGGLTWLSRYPHRYNFPWSITEHNARVQYRLANVLIAVLKAVAAWMLCLLGWEVCRLAVGEPALFGPLFLPGGLLPMLGAIVWYFLRAYRER